MARYKFFLILLLLIPAVYAEPPPNLLWAYDTGNTVNDVAVSPDGSLVAACSGKKVYLLNRSGQLEWNATLYSNALSVTVTSDGGVIAGDEGSLYYFNRTGSMLWEKLIGDSVYDVSTSDGKIAVGSKTRRLYLYDLEGNQLWTFNADSAVYRAVILDGRVAAGTSLGMLYLFDTDGGLIWSVDIKKFIGGLALQDDTVIAGTTYLSFWRDGEKIGTFIESGEVTGLDANSEYVLAGFENGYIYSVDSRGRHIWSYKVNVSREVATSRDGEYFAIASGGKVLFYTPPDITPPTVNIINPEAGATVSGVVKIMAEIDEVAPRIQVLIDDNFACGTLPCNWDTSASSEGKHRITVKAIDPSGNTGEDTVEVIVKRALIQNLTGEIMEKKKELEEQKEKIKETLPPLKTPDYGPTIKKAFLIILALVVIIIIKWKGRKRKKYRFKKK